MASRPGSAQARAPSPGSMAVPTAVMPPARVAMRAGVGSGAPSKNFGPPTLQSDTVVFQAAKIPPSSARNAAALGSAGLLASARGSGAYTARDTYGSAPLASGRAHPMDRSAYDRAPPSPPRRYANDMRRARLHRGTPGQDHSPSPSEMTAPRRSRSPPRSAVERDRGGVNVRGRQADTNGEHPPMRALAPSQRDAAGVRRPQAGEGDATPLAGDAAPGGARPCAAADGPQRAAPSTQRQPRPSSTNGKGSRGAAAARRGSSGGASGSGGVVRLTVRVMKDGDKLGFGIRNDSNRKLKVSTLQSNSTAAKSTLKIGDTILSVNGIDLTGMGFLEVIQQLKATKPGELVFDIERSLDEDDALSGADGSQQGDSMDLDSPLSVAEKRFGPSSNRPSPAPSQQQQLPPQQPQQPPLRPEPADLPAEQQPPHRGAGATPVSVGGAAQQLQRGAPAMDAAGASDARDRGPPPYAHPGDNYTPGLAPEPLRKRPRPAAMTPAQVEAELVRMDKQHRAVLSALTLELKKERTEKLSLEEKNTVLRKRLQNMLIECDEVRVKASATVASIKEHAQRDIAELQQALHAARAQLRLQDRGPDVARTDSIVNDLLATKEQLHRLRQVEMERATNLSNRFSLESRQAEREASRTREELIGLFIAQLRDVARRNYTSNGVRTGGGGGAKDGGTTSSVVVVHWEGLRRLAFAKMFGLPCSYEWYTSDDYYSTALVRHTLRKEDDVLVIFGSTLCHEERAGLFIVAAAPMNVAYDPTNEKLTLSCGWAEQNQLRELARNFRF